MTKEKGISINVLETRRKAAIKNLTSGKPFIEGSLTKIRVTCGNPNCRCAQGEKHISHILTKFNGNVMNSAIFAFKRYEDASLSYTGIDKHEGEQVGGWDTVVTKEEADMLLDRNFKGKSPKPGIGRKRKK